jgi:hypothetical protein
MKGEMLVSYELFLKRCISEFLNSKRINNAGNLVISGYDTGLTFT